MAMFDDVVPKLNRVTNLPWDGAIPPRPGEAAWSQSWQALPHSQGVFDGRGRSLWNHGYDQSYRWYEPDVRETYEADPRLAYQGLVDWGFGDRQRPLLAYARNFYDTAYAAAMAGQEGADAPIPGQVTPSPTGAHWTDNLTPELVYQIRQSFQMQSPSMKGYAIRYMPQGRTVGG